MIEVLEATEEHTGALCALLGLAREETDRVSYFDRTPDPFLLYRHFMLRDSIVVLARERAGGGLLGCLGFYGVSALGFARTVYYANDAFVTPHRRDGAVMRALLRRALAMLRARDPGCVVFAVEDIRGGLSSLRTVLRRRKIAANLDGETRYYEFDLSCGPPAGSSVAARRQPATALSPTLAEGWARNAVAMRAGTFFFPALSGRQLLDLISLDPKAELVTSGPPGGETAGALLLDLKAARRLRYTRHGARVLGAMGRLPDPAPDPILMRTMTCLWYTDPASGEAVVRECLRASAAAGYAYAAAADLPGPLKLDGVRFRIDTRRVLAASFAPLPSQMKPALDPAFF